MKRVSVLVIRRRESYDYMRDPREPPAWGNNDHNNMMDLYLLFVDGVEAMRCLVQTVANHPEARFRDTIAPGQFGMRLFVEPRLFSGRIHGIVGARDLEGDWIDFSSVQPNDLARWLEHDTRKPKAKPTDAEVTETTRVAWSAGCIVHHPNDLRRINEILTAAGATQGSVIPAELVVV